MGGPFVISLFSQKIRGPGDTGDRPRPRMAVYQVFLGGPRKSCLKITGLKIELLAKKLKKMSIFDDFPAIFIKKLIFVIKFKVQNRLILAPKKVILGPKLSFWQ